MSCFNFYSECCTFLQYIWGHFPLLMILRTLTRFPWPLKEKHPHYITFLPACSRLILCLYGQITTILPHHTIGLLIKRWNFAKVIHVLQEQRSLPKMTSIDTSSMQDSSTVEWVTFVPTWSCVSIRDFVVVQCLLWTTGQTFQSSLEDISLFLLWPLRIKTVLNL